MNEYEAKQLLMKYGISVPKGFFLENPSTLDEQRVADLKYPLVVKVCSEKILHKSDVGGVILNIKNFEELKNAVDALYERFSAPVLVEEMIPGGVELIIGVLKDPSFGHAIMFGLGGIFTEIFRDVTFRVIPISRKDAEMMISEIRGSKILDGYRGVKVNKDKIIELLLKVSNMIEEMRNRIEGMDLNPVLATEQDVFVLDAKIIEKD